MEPGRSPSPSLRRATTRPGRLSATARWARFRAMPDGTFSRVPRVAGLATLRWTSQLTLRITRRAGEGWLRRPLRTPPRLPAPPRPRAGPTRAGNTAPRRRGEARMVEPADAPDPASRERSLEGVESLLLHRCHIRRRTDPFALQRIRETGGPALPRAPALRPPVPPISRAGEPAPPSGVGFRSRSPRSGDRPEPPTGPKPSSGVDWIPAPEGVRNEVSTCETQTVTPITALGYAVCRVGPAASFRACHHSIPLSMMDCTICAKETSPGRRCLTSGRSSGGSGSSQRERFRRMVGGASGATGAGRRAHM